MSPLVLTMRGAPDQRLDLSPVVPHLLAGKTAAEIEKIALHTTRTPVTVGDLFRLRMGDAAHIRIEGSGERLDRIGHAMTAADRGRGDVGAQAGRLMRGGSLVVRGSAGPWAGRPWPAADRDPARRRRSPRRAVRRRDRRHGGGAIVVRGGAGARAGDRMRRGTIVVEGRAAPARSRMIAGPWC